MNRSFLWLAFGAIGLLSQAPRSFADCGPAPITTGYSQNYLRAEAKYFYQNLSQYSSNSFDFGVTIPVYNIGIDMGTDASQAVDTSTLNWQNLTESQASQFVQQEHQNVAAQIVDECGYRACKLAELSANSPDPNFLSAVLQFQSQVCLPGSVPTNGSGWPSGASRPILTINPSTLSLTFQPTSPPQDRVLTLINNSPDLKTIVANVAIDYGTNTNANGTVELLKKTGKPLPAGYPIKLSVKPGQSSQFTIRLHPPAGGATVTPKIVVSQVVNASVSSTTQLALLPPVTTKKLASALPATGQTTAYQPNDDGQL